MGAAGRGSVKWIGLNPDPVKLKFLAKGGMQRSSSDPTLSRQRRPASAPSGSVARDRGRVEGFPEPQKSLLPSYLWPADEKPKPAMSIDLDPPEAPCAATEKLATADEDVFASAIPDGRPQSTNSQRSASAPVGPRKRPSSAPAGAVAARRELSRMSSHQHYLEQKLKLEGILGPEAFGSSGAWPSRGAVKPADLTELLYSGTSKEGTNGMGRVAYLRARHTIDPQDVYQKPLTTSHCVGWAHAEGKPAKIIRPVRASAAKSICPC
eukprot:TRINITY_DN26035_c0_g1_i1.p1 TRINITY_DN26035_c0_g1~~TRINITY_DN26035_c0_g1_i1.p1  ORF type:complete len:266 (+),score=26.10 TRINITY_DN26035_c0_g1_i1:253-1050(+)